MYFCATGDGGTAYATTLAQHEANVARYASNWEEADRMAEERDERINEDGTINVEG